MQIELCGASFLLDQDARQDAREFKHAQQTLEEALAVERFEQASRADINHLLLDKLSDALDDKQKYNKISGLLTKLRRRGVIVNTGSDTAPCWRIAQSLHREK